MRVFLTGASGFIGTHVLRVLARSGIGVRALVRRDGSLEADCELVRGDLRDVDAFAESLSGCDAVLHVGALLDPDASEREHDLVNHRATVELARAAEARGVGAFVFVSSIAAIGIRPLGRVGADAPCAPTTAYGRSKRAAEVALLAHEGTMRIAIVRAPTVYGRGERGNFLALTRAIAKGRFLVPGRGANRMSFCHAENLATALELCARADGAKGVLAAADRTPVTLREIADAIAGALGRPSPGSLPMPVARAVALVGDAAGLLGLPAPLASGRLRTLTSEFFLDDSALGSLGYSPLRELGEGVAETIAWYRSAGLLS